MGQIDLASYKNLYIETAKENIDSLLAGCDKLVSDSQNKEAASSLHISSHSLKSKSQVMGLTNMANLCAIIEKISSAILIGSYQISNDFVAVLKESVNELNLCLVQIEKENKETDLESIIKKLEDAGQASMTTAVI